MKNNASVLIKKIDYTAKQFLSNPVAWVLIPFLILIVLVIWKINTINSMMIQFWTSPELPISWEILLGFIILVFVAGIVFLVRHLINRRNEQRLHKAHEYWHKQRCLRVEKLNATEKPSWREIREIEKEFNRGGFFVDGIHNETLARASIVDLIQVSEVKIQIIWNGAEIDKVLRFADDMFRVSYSDEVLATLLERWNEVKKFQRYSGYERLAKEVASKEYLSKFVDLKN